jgi:RNA polymerase sigma-70 factor, ECF subfamily
MQQDQARSDIVQTFESYRPLLFSIAYRMLGSVMEAEDVVQESFLRFTTSDVDRVESPKAYLTTIVTRLCLDQLKSARIQREQYVGPWLPEPLLTAEGPAQVVDQRETITMAFLVLLESLSPVERAVFLLREVFDYDYAEIARITEKSETNCRQIYSRAKKVLVERRTRFESSPDLQQKLVQGFLQAVDSGDVQGLTHVLAEDARWWSDGGGKVSAALHPLRGREAIIRFLLGMSRRRPADLRVEITESNSEPSLLLYAGDALFGVWTFTIVDEKITEIRAVVNPDKLHHLQKQSSGA